MSAFEDEKIDRSIRQNIHSERAGRVVRQGLNSSAWKYLKVCILIALALFLRLCNSFEHFKGRIEKGAFSKSTCPQAPILRPSWKNFDTVHDEILSNDYLNKSVERLVNAVRIRTESFDNLGRVGDDRRWDVFFKFRKYLEETFPEV